MQKIIINNFGAIKYAEIEVKKILVLIGEQASGKSTIAKLIYFFKTIQEDLFSQIYRDKQNQSLDINSKRSNTRGAIDQLKATISWLNYKLSKNYAGLNKEAYVCTPEFYPKFSATWGGFMTEFLEDYQTDLFQIKNKICKHGITNHRGTEVTEK
ncbi:MAG: AAA family ATPase [Dolichospermum sp.]